MPWSHLPLSFASGPTAFPAGRAQIWSPRTPSTAPCSVKAKVLWSSTPWAKFPDPIGPSSGSTRHPVRFSEVVQDTTSLNLTGCRVLPELGPIGSGNLAHGVLLHSTLALTEQGAMLGVLGLQTWVRPAGDLPGPAAKESGKWLHGIDQARQVVWETAWAAGGAAPPRLIHLMDREGDVYEVLQWVEEVGDSAIIRCVQNRRVDDPLRLGHAAVRAQPVLGCVTLTVPRSHGKPARPATVEMRALTTKLCPDPKKYPHAWPLTWTLVEVWEPNPASEHEALHWLLWTREPATTLTEGQEVVRKYTCRWPSEE